MSAVPEMKVTQKELADARIPLHWRDYCSHLLIPLNKCRYDNYYMNWRCQDEKHVYEKCQYDDLQRRIKVKNERIKKSELERIEKGQNPE